MLHQSGKKSTSTPVAFVAFALLLAAQLSFANEGGSPFKSGYFMCESLPLQLRWFTGIQSSTEFTEAGTSTRVPLSAVSPQARKALREGWCSSTDGMEFFSLVSTESCDDHWDQIPNGGCIKVTVSPSQSNYQSTWYTFRDALQ
jgi:hypothetical protein